MAKARLIKKNELVEREQAKVADPPQGKVVKQTVNAVVDWLDQHRNRREDPRKAFNALFARS